MARIALTEFVTPNCIAFLNLIASAVAEGTSSSPLTEDDGYDVLCNGTPMYLNDMKQTPIPDGLLVIEGIHTRFTTYADHPHVEVQINSRGLLSDAAGRYQQMGKFWPGYKAQLHLPDFSPVSQDTLALQLMHEVGVQTLLIVGDIKSAIQRASSRWASLAGAPYGQTSDDVAARLARQVDQYAAFGGKVA